MAAAQVESFIALAREEGGEILCGGGRPTGLLPPFDAGAFVLPTVIAGLSPRARTATEEIFGPVITVHPFDTEVRSRSDWAGCAPSHVARVLRVLRWWGGVTPRAGRCG